MNVSIVSVLVVPQSRGTRSGCPVKLVSPIDFCFVCHRESGSSVRFDVGSSKYLNYP